MRSRKAPQQSKIDPGPDASASQGFRRLEDQRFGSRLQAVPSESWIRRYGAVPCLRSSYAQLFVTD
jgi:hypothetical protein